MTTPRSGVVPRSGTARREAVSREAARGWNGSMLRVLMGRTLDRGFGIALGSVGNRGLDVVVFG